MSRLAAIERYSYNLFELAETQESASKILDELKMIADAFKDNPELEDYFKDKSLSIEKKAVFLNDIFEEAGISQLTRNYFILLLENKRFGYDSPELSYTVFENLNMKKMGIKRGFIKLSRQLNQDEQFDLQERISHKLGFKVQLDFQFDESLIDGSYLEIEGVAYEDNIKKRLSNLHDWMKG